ncbi:MAG: U32 family peptidase [Firmicutes bacterium]|nr:U32 family peptidase [Bacillota bacterium]
MKKQKVELLCPAGDMSKLRLAIAYGADAVYMGGSRFGLRASSVVGDDFLPDAIAYAHHHGKKAYVTVNVFPRNTDFKDLKKYLVWLEKIGADAVIVSDLGALRLAKESTNLEIHISTQANVLNKHTAMEYANLGASRIILARECSLSEITEIAKHLKGKCEIEVFVHGAMCVSYSGRCMLSDYMINRSGNRGECAGSCRWNYSLVEAKRPGEYFPIEEDDNGTYIMNSRDLCLIEHLDELKKAGVQSFKIEGRNKSEYYVAAVTGAYRRAIDGEVFDFGAELEKTAHRPFTTGFIFPNENTMHQNDANPIQSMHVVAMGIPPKSPRQRTVASSTASQCDNNLKIILQRNVFCVGDELEVLSPGENQNKRFTVTKILDNKGQEVTRANKAGELYQIDCPFPLGEFDFLRKQGGHSNYKTTE